MGSAIYDGEALPGDLIEYRGELHIVLCRLNPRQVSVTPWKVTPKKGPVYVDQFKLRLGRVFEGD